MSPSRWRLLLLAVLIMVALSLIAVQCIEGFPLVQAFRKLPWERLDDKVPTPEEIEKDARETFRYTHWFWISQYLMIAGLCLLLVEWWFGLRRGGAARRDAPSGSDTLRQITP
jgi:hypothetical protein